MRKVAVKALYLFLCAILGMVLFAMLHRAIFVLYDLLIFLNYSFAAGMSDATIGLIDFLSLLLALFLGGWYGTLLGIDWYSMVYGPNAERQAGLFHGFLPHHWRGKRQSRRTAAKMSAVKTASAPTAISTIVKVPVKETLKEVKEVAKQAVREWSFDDLITPKPVAKKRTAARKPAIKKTAARKPAVKRTAKTAKLE